MKILFLGDYSNLHSCLGCELRRRGHEVTLLSDGGRHMHTSNDIHLERRPGIMGGIAYMYRLFSLLPQLKGYDVVQLVNSNFLSLRPGRIKYFFDRLREQNGSMFLTLGGNDYYYVKACHDARIFRYSEFKTGSELTEFMQDNPRKMYDWISAANRHWSEYLYENLNGAMSVLPEYDMAARPILGERLAFTNLPIDLGRLPFTKMEIEGQVNLFVGMIRGREKEKGTGRLLSIARELEKEMPQKVKVTSVSNLPLEEYLLRMREGHINLDQLYSYSPATNALQAMAFGRVAASGAQPEYYEYIGHPKARPIISLSPLEPDIKESLRKYILDPQKLVEMGREGRELVERHNDVRIVADRFLAHWEKLGK